MGEIGGVIVPAWGETWPDVDRRHADYVADRLMVIEGVSPEAALAGARVPGAPPRRRPE